LPTHAGRYVLSEAGDAWDRVDADAAPAEGVEPEPAPLALPPASSSAAVPPADPAPPEPEA
jgi:hypothetical protein